MRVYKAIVVALMACCLNVTPAQAQSSYAYYGFEPDIITNYISASGRKLGYIRVTIELMLEDAGNLTAIEHHAPLLRATTIDILGRQAEANIKSLTGREDIRVKILADLRSLLERETGSAMIKDVIFTKYLYQS